MCATVRRLESQVRQTTRTINGLHNTLSRVFPELATVVSDLAAAKQSIGSVCGEIAEQLVRSRVGEILHSQQAEKELESLVKKTFRALPHSPHVHVQTIIGIGELIAAVLVAKMGSIDRFETKRQLVGYFGVFPEPNQSGKDKYGNDVPPGYMEMSRQGCDLVRRYLWMAAKSALD